MPKSQAFRIYFDTLQIYSGLFEGYPGHYFVHIVVHMNKKITKLTRRHSQKLKVIELKLKVNSQNLSHFDLLTSRFQIG